MYSICRSNNINNIAKIEDKNALKVVVVKCFCYLFHCSKPPHNV